MQSNATKPYLKLAATLAGIGGALFFLERYGLDELRKSGVHIDSTILTILLITPAALIVAAAIVFMVGKMRRL